MIKPRQSVSKRIHLRGVGAVRKLAALFTGGKESVYAMLRARELGYEIKELLFLEKPGFSAHKANLSAVKAVARMLGHELTVIKTGNKIENDKNLITHLKRLREEGVSGLLTGNVKLEERQRIHKELCEKAGLMLVEPLRELDTLELIMEYSKIGLEFMIISIRDERLDPKWLGTVISKQNIENFLAETLSNRIDPCGEYGEYHSLVIGLSNLKIELQYKLPIITVEEGSKIKYAVLQKFD